MTIRDILNILFKRKYVVTAFLAASIIGGYSGLVLIAPTYEASARLIMRIGSEDVYMPALPSSQFRTPVVSVVREDQLRSEANILNDPALARKVVDELTPMALFPSLYTELHWYSPKSWLKLASQLYGMLENYFFPLSANRTNEDKAIDAFENALKVEPIKNSNLIEVSFRNKLPNMAAEGVNSLLKIYLKERGRIFQREQSAFFSAQLSTLDRQLRETEGALESFRGKEAVSDLDKQQAAQVDNLNDTRKRIDDNAVAVSQQERRLAKLREQLARIPAMTQISGSTATNDFALSELNKQLADVQKKEIDIAKHFADADPRLSVLHDQKAVLLKLIAEQRDNRDSSDALGINPLSARIRDDLMQTEASLAGMKQMAMDLAMLEKTIVQRLDEYNRQEATYKQLTQRLQVLRDSRKLYLEKVEEGRLASAEANAQIGNISVISYATPPDRPVSPKLWLVIVGVVLGGLIGGIGLAFLFELFDDSMQSDTDVRRHLKLPLLAKFPDLS